MAQKKRGTWIADQFRAVGAVVTINSQSVRVLHRDPSGDVLMATGAFAVTDGGAGYAKGAMFLRTNGSVASTLYINEGTNSSCDFNAMETSASTITGVTAGNGMTGGGTEGSVTLNVVAGSGLTASADDIAAGAGHGVTLRADAIDIGQNVYNNTGGTLTPGTLVRLAGFTTTNGVTVAKADADGANAATHVVVDAITNDTAGVVYPVATVTGLATNGRTIGDAVYLDATTAGGFVFTPPTGADQTAQLVGFVKVVDASVGEIVFNLMNGAKRFPTSSLQNGSVTATQLASDAVTTVKILDSNVTTAKIADGNVTTAKLGKATVSNIEFSQVKTKTISGAALKALLNGATNNVAAFVAGDFVCDAILAVSSGGGVATIDLGTDAGFSAGAGADTLLVNVDANATGITRLTMLDEANQTATGAKGTAASGAANVTITSSADISGGAFAGTLVIFYV